MKSIWLEQTLWFVLNMDDIGQCHGMWIFFNIICHGISAADIRWEGSISKAIDCNRETISCIILYGKDRLPIIIGRLRNKFLTKISTESALGTQFRSKTWTGVKEIANFKGNNQTKTATTINKFLKKQWKKNRMKQGYVWVWQLD